MLPNWGHILIAIGIIVFIGLLIKTLKKTDTLTKIIVLILLTIVSAGIFIK